jgi:hypothetical protein
MDPQQIVFAGVVARLSEERREDRLAREGVASPVKASPPRSRVREAALRLRWKLLFGR